MARISASIRSVAPSGVGRTPSYEDNIDRISQFVDAGYGDRIIIGSDTGWFDPGQPGGFELEEVDGVLTMVGTYAGDYSQIPAEFVPAMQEAGFSDELITKLMQDNPWSRLLPLASSRCGIDQT